MNKAQLLTHLIEIQEQSDEEFEIITGFHGDKTIKRFMAMYNIIDIKMRMLKVSELKRIMGFPSDYVLKGSQSEQKKFIGNAVEVGMARVLCEALCERLEETERRIAV